MSDYGYGPQLDLPEPDFDGRAFLRSSLEFGRELRRAGLTTDLGAVMDYARALGLVDIGDREQVRAAGAAIFVRRRDEIPAYDRVFNRFWRRRARGRPGDAGPALPGEPPKPGQPAAEETPAGDEGSQPQQREEGGLHPSGVEATGDEEEGPEGRIISARAWSSGEVSQTKEFDRMTSAELRDAEAFIDRIEPNLERRITRRHELHPHGRVLAPRAMFRRNMSTGGDLVEWVWRRRTRRPRSIVVLCDVSGSMERHARLLLRFAQALTRSRQVRTEAFVFGTRLTRVTHELRHRNPDVALQRVSAVVRDWSGGTRIGDSFHEFNVKWARRVLRTSGVVIVVSDGWDRGRPSLVAEETARLQRNCHRLVWLNPLAGASGYQPLAAGMAAAYPFIDDFLPVHNLASLERLARVLGGLSAGRRAIRPARRGSAARASGGPTGSAAGAGGARSGSEAGSTTKPPQGQSVWLANTR